MKILFVSHDAYRAGAQMLLLQLLQWIKRSRQDIAFDTLLLGEGRLTADFESVSDQMFVLAARQKSHSGIKSFISSKMKTKNRRDEKVLNALGTTGYDVIYANSVASLSKSILLKEKLGCPLVLHVHELESMIEDRVPDFDSLSPQVDLFIAASKLVKKNLVENHLISPERIKVIYEFSEVKSLKIKKEQGDNWIIGGSGSLSYRKGIDIFIQAAILFTRRFPEIKVQFRWIGGGGSSLREAKREVEKADMQEIIDLIGLVDNPHDYYSNFDIFLMTSREDPFPLVCIEAGQLGKPIICFSGVTGTEEIVKQGGGVIVPYLDLMELTSKIDDYFNDPERLTNDGICAKKLFSEFTPEKICPQIIDAVNEVVNR